MSPTGSQAPTPPQPNEARIPQPVALALGDKEFLTGAGLKDMVEAFKHKAVLEQDRVSLPSGLTLASTEFNQARLGTSAAKTKVTEFSKLKKAVNWKGGENEAIHWLENLRKRCDKT